MKFLFFSIIFIFIIIMPIQVQAQEKNYSGIFEIMDEQFISNISELPQSVNLFPVIAIQHSSGKSISGWVNILGFKNMVLENGTWYIRGDPKELIIYQGGSGVYDNPEKPIVSPFSMSDLSVVYDSFDNTFSVSQRDAGNITVNLHVTLKWHNICTNGRSRWICGYDQEDQDFYTTAIIPKQYPRIKDVNISAIEYNNSLLPKTVISLDISEVSAVNYNYNAEVIHNIRKVARVERLPNGVYYANITPANIWTSNTETMHRIGGEISLKNVSNPDYRNLTVNASTIYETKEIKNISVKRKTIVTGEILSPLFYFSLSILILAIISIRIMIRGKL